VGGAAVVWVDADADYLPTTQQADREVTEFVQPDDEQLMMSRSRYTNPPSDPPSDRAILADSMR
jgi:hypothetical protein